MKRFFVDKISDMVVLRGDEHNHLAFVLRSKIGESVVLCPQDGYDYIAEILEITKVQTTLRVTDKQKNLLEPKTELTLFSALMKGEKLDLVVQKITELGAKAIYPVITKFVQNKKENIKAERENKIAAEASKQCGRAVIPKINGIISFENMLVLLKDFDLVIFPYEGATEPDLKTFLTDKCVQATGESAPKKVAVLIGSEGGFSTEEVEQIRGLGVTPITLGKRILRAETACIAVVAMAMYQLEELK